MTERIATMPGTAATPSAPRGCLGLWCFAWTLLTAVYLLALVVLEKVLPEHLLPAYLATYLPQPVLVAPMAAAPFFCLVFWQRRLLLANLLLVLLAIIVLMPPTLPHGRPKALPAEQVRILSWNVHNDFRHEADLRQAIAKEHPQIVCLQEAQRDVFATLLPGAETAHTQEVTTLTSGHIEARKQVWLGPHPNRRWALETTIRLPQGRLTVLDVHFMTAFTPRTVKRNRNDLLDFLLRTRAARDIEADAVVAWLGRTAGPRVVVGDFNSPPNSDIYHQIRAVAMDAFTSGLGWGYTYHRRHPMVRIDHVFCSGGVIPLAARSLDGVVSDHRLVVADVAL